MMLARRLTFLLSLVLLSSACSDDNNATPTPDMSVRRDMSVAIDQGDMTEDAAPDLDTRDLDATSDLADSGEDMVADLAQDMEPEHFETVVEGEALDLDDIKTCDDYCQQQGAMCELVTNDTFINPHGGLSEYDGKTGKTIGCDEVPKKEDEFLIGGFQTLVKITCYCVR